jgi:hypothetical protein
MISKCRIIADCQCVEQSGSESFHTLSIIVVDVLKKFFHVFLSLYTFLKKIILCVRAWLPALHQVISECGYVNILLTLCLYTLVTFANIVLNEE